MTVISVATCQEQKRFMESRIHNAIIEISDEIKYIIDDLEDDNSIIMKITQEGELVVIPEEEHEKIINFVHEYVLSHVGADNVFNYLKTRVADIPINMVRSVIRGCRFCSRVRDIKLVPLL